MFFIKIIPIIKKKRYHIIKEKDQIESQQLWYRSGVYITDKTQKIVLSETNVTIYIHIF